MNILSLEEWREQIGYNPYHFWQLAGAKAPVTSACNSIVRQYAWQGADMGGRSDIRSAIEAAETRISTFLHYSPAPHYVESTLSFPRYPQTNVYRAGFSGADGRWITLQLPEGQIQAVGIETRTVIQANAATVLSDTNVDTLYDTFTVTVPAGTITDVSEVAVYFASANRLYGDDITDEKYRIKPVKVTITGGNIVIKGRSWLIVKPNLYEGFNVNQNGQLDPSDTLNYAAAVDVYRRYTAAGGTTFQTSQAALVWESQPYPSWITTPYAGYDVAGVAYAMARVTIRDAERGIVGLAESVYDTPTDSWYSYPWWDSSLHRPPDRVIIRYLAGYPLDAQRDFRLNPKMSYAVSRMATAETTKRICACDIANRELAYWQFDLARTSGAADESYGMISREDLNNPFGTRRGQVMAYKEVKANRVLTGFVAG